MRSLQSKGQYINGGWRKGHGTVLESMNPADGSILWQGTNATEEDINLAYHAAKQATKIWANTSFEQRCKITSLFTQAIEQCKNELAQLISLETGKPLWESHTEVQAVIGKNKLSIQAYQERTSPQESLAGDITQGLRYKPHGIVVVLGAFNFPAHLSNGHIIPALLAGNTVLYKPSEQSPAVAELIMECWHQSGLPAGVINCLQGDASCGKELLAQDIQGVYFTGSYATGLHIHQHFNNRPEVILALEMGGNNPLIIDEINDLQAGVYHTLLSSFITSGQRCTCARRVFVPNSSFGDTFLQNLLHATKQLKIGPFTQNPEPFMGPVISHIQALKHLHTQKKWLEMGGNALLRMSLLSEYTGFLSPGLIDMTAATSYPDEELFAPCIQIYRYDQFEQAIDLANQTRYGLAAGLFSDKQEHFQLFYQEIRAGLINWNRPTTGASSALPFGGVGRSGNHRPSAYFAADYCAYPIASMEQSFLNKPEQLLPGIILEA